MVNHWIFVVNEWTDKTGKKWKGKEIFDTLQADRIWGIGDKTPNRKKLSKGDRVVIYLAGSDSSAR